MWLALIVLACYLLPATIVLTHYSLELGFRSAVYVLNDPVITPAVYRYPLALVDRLLPKMPSN